MRREIGFLTLAFAKRFGGARSGANLVVLALGITIGVAVSALGETRLIPPIGTTQPAADDRYVNVTGDTITGNFACDGNTTLGNAMGDSVTSNAGTWTFPNSTILDASGKTITCKGTRWNFELVDYVTISDATTGTDAMNRNASDARYVEIAGDTMTGYLTVGGNLTTQAVFTANGQATFQQNLQMSTARLEANQGADVASADEMLLGDGNYFDVTGTTTINHITKTGWQAGSVVVLQFDASVTVTHNAGSPAGTEASILLSGGGDFSATVDDTLQLVYDGTTFCEVSRTVI